MSKEITVTKTRIPVRSMMLVSLMTAICCILAPISIPIGPVPISLSVMAVLFCAYILEPWLGSLTVALYILIGLVGLPVFSGYAGGPAKLFGPTGGYILGYLPLVFITGLFVRKWKNTWFLQLLGMFLGLALCYITGTTWFMLLTKMSLAEALALCVYPFIAFDLVKIVTAFFLGNTITRTTDRYFHT